MFDVPGNPVGGPGMRGLIYQMLYKSILREKVRPERLNRGVFHATNDRLFFGTGLEGGGVTRFQLKVWQRHIPLSDSFHCLLFPTTRPPACRTGEKGGDESDPPQKWGGM